MRHHNRLFLFPICLLALALAGASARDKDPKKAPQDPPAAKTPAARNPYVERFKELDRDRDGYVSPAEWPLEPASFHVVDRDQDGRLSPTELLTPNVLREPSPEVQFRQLDVDRDGRLSRSERQREGLDRRDRDRDGYITLPEFRQDTFGSHATGLDQIRFRNLDRNRDNRLNRTEWTGSSLLFNHLDRNGDGVISPDEWPR